jgi:peptidoglycan/LPS O-acetylase OafA/YrhL
MRRNATFFVLIGVAAAIVVLFVVPFLRDTGHPLLGIPIVIFFVLLIVYGRHNAVPKQRRKNSSLRSE